MSSFSKDNIMTRNVATCKHVGATKTENDDSKFPVP